MKQNTSILTSQLLSEMGVVHGFTTRLGGVSKGVFSSLNFSFKVGDLDQAVEANRLLWERITGLGWKNVVELNQVHGSEVLVVDEPLWSLDPLEHRSFDACVTCRQGAVLAISTADCVPILLYSQSPKAIGAVHAGWRGTIAGVAKKAVTTMVERLGCHAAGIHAVIGPCIHFSAFSVGPDVYKSFEDAFGPRSVGMENREFHVDLVESNRLALVGVGLFEESIQVLDYCTFSDENLFYSHRRDHGKTGRHLSYISLV